MNGIYPMSYDLIIFDCDGTLVDSEYLNNKVTTDLLAELGLPQYDLDYALKHFAGRTLTDIGQDIHAETGVRLPPEFMDNYVRGVKAGMPSLLKAIEGVAATLEKIEPHIKICVGSNGERSNVLDSIHHAGLGRFFPDDHVFTKSMVRHPKPAPDLFLLAAERMGAQPAHTLVVEDSATGTKAGIAAGMTVVGLTATFHDREGQAALLREAGAHHIAGRFHDILAFLDRAMPRREA